MVEGPAPHPSRDPGGSHGFPDGGRPGGSRDFRRRVALAKTRADELRSGARSRLESERARRGWVRTAFEAWDLDRRRGGPLLAGGLAYRIFLWQLPAALFLVSLLGVASEGADSSPAELARRAGLNAAVAQVVSEAVSEAGGARWWLLVVGMALTVWSGRAGARAAALTSAIAWNLPTRTQGTTSGLRASLWFSAALLAGVAIQVLAPALFGGGLLADVAAWVVVTIAVCALVLLVMDRLPRGDAGWRQLLPGALFVTLAMRGLGLATGVYFAGRLERVDDLYGGLGVAIVILLYLYLAARSFVWGQFLNARLAGAGAEPSGSPSVDSAG